MHTEIASERSSPMRIEQSGPELGVVAIGRNEGERLRRCLDSVRKQCSSVVYVDSGSQDGSVAMARGLGVEVVELDLAIPFTAARARNEGLRRLRELRPQLEFVQFVDGDCELMPGWIEAALERLRARPEAVVVCGRRRERFRNATIYNRLCDMEWNTPLGEVLSCGGDALMRVQAVAKVGGFDPGLICHEEPDLCRRLRAQGLVILRIDAEMTLHDAAMTRAIQWWRRSVRGGFGAAEALARNEPDQREYEWHVVRGALIWVVGLPTLAVTGFAVAIVLESGALALAVAGMALLLLAAQTVRIAVRRDAPGENAVDALLYGAACMLGKLPQSIGMLRAWRMRKRQSTPALIEYK